MEIDFICLSWNQCHFLPWNWNQFDFLPWNWNQFDFLPWNWNQFDFLPWIWNQFDFLPRNWNLTTHWEKASWAQQALGQPHKRGLLREFNGTAKITDFLCKVP